LDSVVHRNVSHYESNIFLVDVSIAIKVIHVKDKLDLFIKAGVVDLEKSSDKGFQVDVASLGSIHDSEESLSNYSGKLAIR
jgi:hypothetical protein